MYKDWHQQHPHKTERMLNDDVKILWTNSAVNYLIGGDEPCVTMSPNSGRYSKQLPNPCGEGYGRVVHNLDILLFELGRSHLSIKSKKIKGFVIWTGYIVGPIMVDNNEILLCANFTNEKDGGRERKGFNMFTSRSSVVLASPCNLRV